MVVILWLLVASNNKASVLKLLIVVVVAAVCATVALPAFSLGRFWANQAGFAGSENGEVTFETWGVC